jgi:hypothetical protein
MKNLPFIWLAANIPVAINKRQGDPNGQYRMENPETRTTLEARQGTAQDKNNYTKRTTHNAKMMTNGSPNTP